MSMYKRPLPRVRNIYDTRKPVNIPTGSFLHGLLNPGLTIVYKYEPAPVYKKESYLEALKKHYESYGIPYKEPQLPDYYEPIKPVPKKEPEIVYGDQVYLKLKILKSGVVRIKLDTSIATLYERYYKKGVRPPMKNILQAYKSMGFSNEYLEKIKKSFEKNVQQQKRVGGVIDKIFNKDPVKKVKKKKKEEDEIVEEEVNDDDDDDDELSEDDGLDVEPDVEEEVVEEEPADEEYLSD